MKKTPKTKNFTVSSELETSPKTTPKGGPQGPSIINIDEKNFKKKYKPAACTIQPWRKLIPADKREQILAKIKQETINAYGYSMEECPKRKTCITKKCIGRPLPWKSITAKKYLQKLEKTHLIKDKELYIINCSSCKIQKKCKSTCLQINDWITRAKNTEPNMIYKENLDNFINLETNSSPSTILNQGLEIPWGCLSDLRKDVIKLYLYEQKDFAAVASELQLHDQARAKYEFYAGLTKLAEYATMRMFWKQHHNDLTILEQDTIWSIYYDHLTMQRIAAIRGVSKQAVQQTLARVIDKYNIKWHIYVRKKGNKTIYNVPELMK